MEALIEGILGLGIIVGAVWYFAKVRPKRKVHSHSASPEKIPPPVKTPPGHFSYRSMHRLLVVVILLSLIIRISILGWLAIIFGLVIIVLPLVLHYFCHRRFLQKNTPIALADFRYVLFSHVSYLSFFLLHFDIDDVREKRAFEQIMEIFHHDWSVFLSSAIDPHYAKLLIGFGVLWLFSLILLWFRASPEK